MYNINICLALNTVGVKVGNNSRLVAPNNTENTSWQIYEEIIGQKFLV